MGNEILLLQSIVSDMLLSRGWFWVCGLEVRGDGCFVRCCSIGEFQWSLSQRVPSHLLTYSSGVHILLRPHQTESTHPQSTEALNTGTSPIPDFSYSKCKYALYFFQIFSLPTFLTELIHPPSLSPRQQRTSPTLHASIHPPHTRPCPVKHNIGHIWTTPRKSHQEYRNNPSKPYSLQNLPS
jgi:hypothetical protein